jgi:hypothetical protein
VKSESGLDYVLGREKRRCKDYLHIGYHSKVPVFGELVGNELGVWEEHAEGVGHEENGICGGG